MSKPRQTLAERDSAPASRGDPAGLRFGAMDPTHEHLRRVAGALIAATNAFAVEQVLGFLRTTPRSTTPPRANVLMAMPEYASMSNSTSLATRR